MSDKNTDYNAAWLKERSECFSGIRNELKIMKEQGIFNGKRIAIVGAWNNAAEINDIIRSLDMEISIIADNNPNKHGLSRLGIMSQSVESLVCEKDIVILVLSKLYWRDIQSQLQTLGFIKNKNFFVVFGGRKFELESGAFEETSIISVSAWDKICTRAKKGYILYCELIEKYPRLQMWLMHQPSLGDLYIFSLFLPVAMGVKNICECECLLIVTKNSVKKLAEAIGFKYIVLISFEEANDWLSTIKLMGDKLNVNNAVYHGLNNIFQSLVWNTSVTFRDSFTKYVFHFDKEVTPVYPQFAKRREVVRNEFKRLNLKIGKTVVISPYAGHFKATITLAQWKRLTDALTANGYTLCTNCGNVDEIPLSGTVPAFIELQDCVEFVETARYFIGIRSGFCDLLCMANCQKVVIYETGAPAASIDYFGFENMGIGNGKFIEVINDCMKTDELIDDIVERFKKEANK